MSLLNSTSTPADGSSRNNTLGSCAKALAISTRLFIPPDNCKIFESFCPTTITGENYFYLIIIRLFPNKPLEKRTVLITFSNGSNAISGAPNQLEIVPTDNSISCQIPNCYLTAVGTTSPQTAEIRVVFPARSALGGQEFRPLTSKETFSSATCPSLYLFESPVMDSIFVMLKYSLMEVSIRTFKVSNCFYH